MESNSFIDRFFHSSHELVDFRQAGDRDINTLYTFLELMHTTHDRFSTSFKRNDLREKPEFKLLRLIRNYFHHAGDVDEFRVFQTHDGVFASHAEMIIIPVALVARAVISFQKKANNKVSAERELTAIASFFSDFEYISANSEYLSSNPPFRDGGKDYYFGFDIYKAVYNVTNIVSDICRSIDVLAEKRCVIELEDGFAESNNIEKYDMYSLPGTPQPLLTTQGFIIPKRNT